MNLQDVIVFCVAHYIVASTLVQCSGAQNVTPYYLPAES